MKRCSRCGEIKLLDAFSRHKGRADGRQPRCKACMKAYHAARYAANREAIAERRRANRDALAEYQRAYRAANRDAEAERHRTYHAANRAAIAEQQRAYRAANRDAIAERQRAYRRANPHVSWEARYRRRVRRYGFQPVVESFTRADLVARYGDQCWHCGGDWDQLDHHPVPVHQGGLHTLANTRPSCTPCNKRTWKANAA